MTMSLLYTTDVLFDYRLSYITLVHPQTVEILDNLFSTFATLPMCCHVGKFYGYSLRDPIREGFKDKRGNKIYQFERL